MYRHGGSILRMGPEEQEKHCTDLAKELQVRVALQVAWGVGTELINWNRYDQN